MDDNHRFYLVLFEEKPEACIQCFSTLKNCLVDCPSTWPNSISFKGLRVESLHLDVDPHAQFKMQSPRFIKSDIFRSMISLCSRRKRRLMI